MLTHDSRKVSHLVLYKININININSNLPNNCEIDFYHSNTIYTGILTIIKGFSNNLLRNGYTN